MSSSSKDQPLVSDGMIDILANEALEVVMKTDYSKLCPVPGQDKVERFHVMLSYAQWQRMKTKKTDDRMRAHYDDQDSDSGVKVSVLRDLLSITGLSASKSVAILKIIRDGAVLCCIAYLLYLCKWDPRNHVRSDRQGDPVPGKVITRGENLGTYRGNETGSHELNKGD